MSTVDVSYAGAMAHASKQAAKFRYDRDLLDIRIKSEQQAYDEQLALHLASCMDDETRKRWSNASTPASARKAIEQTVLLADPFVWHVSIDQLKIDLAGLDFQAAQARADYEMFATLAWREVADLLGKSKVHLALLPQLPHEIPHAIGPALADVISIGAT